MAFYDNKLSFSLDGEIKTLCSNAVDQLKKVDANSNQQKKQIITELAKKLEDKVIPTNTVCIEIVNQLRGTVSESFIRKCLDQKYKDTRRSQNAKQQNKANPTKLKKVIKNVQNRLNKVDETYPEAIISYNINDDVDNLALQGALEREKCEDPVERENEEKKEQLLEVVAMASNNGSQVLIRRDESESNSFDEDGCDDTKYLDLDSKSHLREKDYQTSSELSDEPIEQKLPSKCSGCKKKMN